MALLDDFDASLPTYQHLSGKLEPLVCDLLASAKLRYHSVDVRIKDRKSFSDKVKSRPEKYKNVADVTDICGIRVITYFEDDIEDVAAVIRREFSIDEANSVDKRQMLDADRFGYMSLHYVATLNEERAALQEYKRSAGIKFEVQIRSILQHAWAEIEHDLKYKNREAIPREVQRRFARLAGLLEVADSEFKGIRDVIQAYKAEVAQNIELTPAAILVNLDSLQILARTNRTVHEIDETIAGFMGEALEDEVSFSDGIVPVFVRTGLQAIDDVEKALRNSTPELVRFAQTWIRMCDDQGFFFSLGGVQRGITFYYLALFMLGYNTSENAIAEILTAAGYAFSDDNLRVAAEIRRTRARAQTAQ